LHNFLRAKVATAFSAS